MAISFAQVIEAMGRDRAGAGPLMDSGDEDRSLRVIRSGNALRDGDDGSFWDDFVALCGDPDGLGKLLGVRPDQVVGWASKVERAKDRVARHDQMPEEAPEEDNAVIPTGNNGAITRDNMGPTGPMGGV